MLLQKYTSYPYVQGTINQQNTYIRVLHAVPNAPAVDVYVNEKKIGTNLTYREFSEYVTLPAGQYSLQIFPAGQKDSPVIQKNVNIPAGSIYTVVASGTLPNIELVSVPEPRADIPQGMTYVRFAHFSPNAPNVDVRLPDGSLLFQNIGYKEMASYIPVRPGTYTFEVFPTGGDKRVLYVPNITLKANRFYTIYAVGLVGNTETPLQVLVPLDGNSYL